MKRLTKMLVALTAMLVLSAAMAVTVAAADFTLDWQEGGGTIPDFNSVTEGYVPEIPATLENMARALVPKLISEDGMTTLDERMYYTQKSGNGHILFLGEPGTYGIHLYTEDFVNATVLPVSMFFTFASNHKVFRYNETYFLTSYNTHSGYSVLFMSPDFINWYVFSDDTYSTPEVRFHIKDDQLYLVTYEYEWVSENKTETINWYEPMDNKYANWKKVAPVESAKSREDFYELGVFSEMGEIPSHIKAEYDMYGRHLEIENLSLKITNLDFSLSSAKASVSTTPETPVQPVTPAQPETPAEQETPVQPVAPAIVVTESKPVAPAATPISSDFIASADVNVRASASANANKLGYIKKGSAVQVIEKTGDWYKVQFGDKIGYVYVTYLNENQNIDLSGAVTKTVTSESLNVRTGAGTKSKVIGHLAKGDSVSVIGTEGDWSKIAYYGSIAYVHSNYIK